MSYLSAPMAAPAGLTGVQAADLGYLFANEAFDCDVEFESFMGAFERKYTDSDNSIRRGIFCDNLRDIAEHNSDMEATGTTWWKKVTTVI